MINEKGQFVSVDISGKKYNKLTAISFDHNSGHEHYWLFLCECGKSKVIRKGIVVRGEQISCGCEAAKLASDRLKGNTYRVGRNVSGKTRAKMSRSRIGKSPWNKGIPYPQISGEKNNRWKGGITPENTKIRHSIEYKKWRTSVFERDKFTCVLCGERGGELNADHIKTFSEHPKLRFVLENGRTLCKPCHIKTDTYLNKPKRAA